MKIKMWSTLALLFIIFFAVSATNVVRAAITQLATPPSVPVGSGPEWVAYDSGKGEVFVPNNGDGTVSVISDSTDTVVATVTVGQYPVGIAYDASMGEIFVTNSGANSVSIISDSTNQVVATIPVGSGPEGAAYDS